MTTQERRSGEERREQIAQAVLHIVGTTGITSLTTTALAREIGVTSGALFRHFKSRDEILREAVRYATRQIDETFPDEALPAPERIVGLARNRLQVLRSRARGARGCCGRIRPVSRSPPTRYGFCAVAPNEPGSTFSPPSKMASPREASAAISRPRSCSSPSWERFMPSWACPASGEKRQRRVERSGCGLVRACAHDRARRHNLNVDTKPEKEKER